MADDSAQSDVAGSVHELSAGAQSRELGISHWIVENDTFRAVDQSATRVAEIRIDRPTLTIQSVYPEEGSLGIRDKTVNTFSERTAKYLTALKSDLAEAAKVEPAGSTIAEQKAVVDKAEWTKVDCFFLDNDCVNVGQTLLMNFQIADYRCTWGHADICLGDNFLTLLEILPLN